MAKTSKSAGTKSGQGSEFEQAVTDLGKLCGSTGRAMKNAKGGYEFRLAPAKRKSFKLEKVQSDFLKRGCYVFNNDTIEKDRIAVLPKTQWPDVLLAMQTAGPNWNLTTQKIIAWLRKLEKQQPFIVTGANEEHVSVRFTTKVKNVEDMALRILDFSPDLDNFDELMTQLPKTGKFMLWWT